jgi:hypothetical protein
LSNLNKLFSNKKRYSINDLQKDTYTLFTYVSSSSDPGGVTYRSTSSTNRNCIWSSLGSS